MSHIVLQGHTPGALDDENEDGYGAGVTLEDYVTHDDVGDYDGG
jgi:hypothetical protein